MSPSSGLNSSDLKPKHDSSSSADRPLPTSSSLWKSQEAYAHSKGTSPYLNPDPRTSSTQSLVSLRSESDHRRTLLLIYIHGFYGNDQSFRSFPYHLHSFLKEALVETHVIHSKIYPRYKTYRALEIARDNFSAWLEPHESPTTDVILVGHSMGGILAADVVLMKPDGNPYRTHPFKHRILGTISLDSPFLGLHPGIVVSGISSLFQSAPEQPNQEKPDGNGSNNNLHLQPPPPEATLTLPPNRQPTDPFFNPAFFNDNPFKEAPFFKRIKNFAKKHSSEGILNATAKHLLSHLEYGGCLADYPGLNARYQKIRQLEDVDELQALSEGRPLGDTAQVRFVNYYTLSSGRPKPPKTPQDTPSQSLSPVTTRDGEESSLMSRETTEDTSQPATPAAGTTPGVSVEDLSDYSDANGPSSTSKTDGQKQSIGKSDTNSIQAEMDNMALHDMEPLPMSSEDDRESVADKALQLPPIPDLPETPNAPDFDQFPDKDARKQAEKEYKRVLKSYDQAVKNHTKASRERERILEKRRQKARKELERLEKQESKEMEALQREQKAIERQETFSSATRSALAEAPVVAPDEGTDGRADAEKKKKKNKKFCTLPRQGSDGARDTAWVDIYMDGVDEVGAHCGLFFPGPHYDRLIGDVSSRIVGWIHDDLSKRMVMELQREQGPIEMRS